MSSVRLSLFNQLLFSITRITNDDKFCVKVLAQVFDAFFIASVGDFLHVRLVLEVKNWFLRTNLNVYLIVVP